MDECLQVNVVPPKLDDQIVNLFVNTTIEYPPAKSNYNCGPIITTLLGVEVGYPAVNHDPADYSLSVLGTDPERHVDEFPLVFNSCIELNGQPYGCRNSTTFRLLIQNPCDTSVIQSYPLPDTLIAPIMGYDEATLFGVPTYWPWDEVFYVNDLIYTNFCKPYSYDIVYKGTNMLVDFVSLSDASGLLKLHPDTNSPLGTTMLTLRTKLYIWPNYNVINYEDFPVTVTECVPTLNSNGVALADRFTKWGFNTAYYDIAFKLNQFTMAPNCGY